MTISDDWAVLRSAKEQDGLRVNLGTIFGKVVSSEPYRPVIVLGPQRSYKTAGVAIPAALEWPGAALVTSVRRDILDDTFDFRRSIGQVSIFDPARTLKGTRFEPFCASWNILEKCRSWDGSVRTSRALTESGRLGSSDLREGDFWHSLAAQLLSPHLFAAAANGYGMKDVIRWIRTQEEYEVRSLLQATGNELAMMAVESAWQREDRARSSVYTTLESALRAFDYEDTGIGEAPFIDLQGFLAAPSNTIYICAPPDEQEEYRPLFTGLVRMVIREAYLRNNAAADLRDTGPRPTATAGSACNLMLLLDEAGNIARLENLSTLATTAAGTNIQLVTIFHDISQIEALYGRFEAYSIVNNHSALVVLPGMRDVATLDYIGALLKGERVGLSEDAHWSGPRPIRSMLRGEGLLIYENLRPTLLQLRSKFTNERLQHLASLRSDPGQGEANVSKPRPRRRTKHAD